MIVHGTMLSPYCRKVYAAFAEKGLAFETKTCIPVPPKSPEVLARSPLGKIPFLEDEGVFLPDSSVICAYLERLRPSPALFPAEPRALGRALFLEEYADTKLIEVCGPPIFERRIRVDVLGQETDEARVEKTLRELAPPVFTYLEGELASDREFLGDAFSVADLAVGSQLQSLALAGVAIDRGRWPRLAGYAERVVERPSFVRAAEVRA